MQMPKFKHPSDPRDRYPKKINNEGQTPPKVKVPFITMPTDDSDCQIAFSTLPFYPDPEYPIYPTHYNGISKPRSVTPMVTVSAIYPVLLGISRRALYDFRTLILALVGEFLSPSNPLQ